MRISGPGLLLLLCTVSPLCAQVSVEVKLDQDQFLPGENLPVAVRITNRSGQPLSLGADEEWLSFSIESKDGSVVPRNGDPSVAGPFTLDSSKVATKRVDLTPAFTLTQPGRYSITATVRIKDWQRQVSSPPKNFTIIHGAHLWEQEFGLPGSRGSNAVPEVRKFVLQQANYVRGELRLYLGVTDATGVKVFRVLPLGTIFSFSRVDPQLDRFSNLHVLYANGPHSYSYNVISPDGDLLERQTYDYIESRPRLRADENGRISVMGGERRLSASDIPAETAAPVSNDAPTAKP